MEPEDYKKLLRKQLDAALDAIESQKTSVYSMINTIIKEAKERETELQDIKFEHSSKLREAESAEKHLQKVRNQYASDKNRDEEYYVEVITQLDLDVKSLNYEKKVLWDRMNELERKMREFKELEEEAKKIEISMGAIASYLTSQVKSFSTHIDDTKKELDTVSRIIMASEDERKRISRDLHDTATQDIAASLQMANVAILCLDKGKYDELKPTLLEIRDLIQKSESDMRNVIFDMRPMSLDDQGLNGAIHELCSELDKRGTLKTSFNTQGTPIPIPKYGAVVLFRIVQECLSNVAKHSGQKYANVEVNYTPKGVFVVVEDKGVGFDMHDNIDENGDTRHFGVVGMKERAKLIGAQFSIYAEANKGARVRLFLPAFVE